ncbi:TMV resistance protein N-like [Cynara cardunculus var. scolymus]|uniref:TMV resistance protein N-like n=1 Tax=Cynara cardunculus var. scolymus TaxID=59895 RepID=UPI000D62A309|nr:TMV resistance protein N-like [Cynara cardunculus var. scolymus]
MECRDRMGQKVLPVFYHVDPSNLRGQKGKFTTAFQQNEEKFRGEIEKLNKWRESLVTASKISGWHVSKAVNVGESEVINKIVKVILEGIQPDGNENELIGIEYHLDALISLLCMEATEDVLMIGIWGMGGIGKTTIAQAVFRRIAYKFEGSCFVKDVRENSCSKRDRQVLQDKIIRDVLVPHDHRVRIQDLDHGADMMRKSFSNKKVLLVLDDVDNVNQLEFLTATDEWYGPGSRIIVTTRDEHLLADAHSIYKPNCLLMDQAVKLFSRHAFRHNSPPEGTSSCHIVQYSTLAIFL